MKKKLLIEFVHLLLPTRIHVVQKEKKGRCFQCGAITPLSVYFTVSLFIFTEQNH